MFPLDDLMLYREILRPVFDILLLAFLIYRGYLIFVQTRAVQLFKGAVFLIVIYLTAFFFRLTTVLWILNTLAPSIVIGIAIIFQPELRKIFTRLGQSDWFRTKSLSQPHHVESVLNAVEILSDRNRGALVVFTRTVGLKHIIESGTKLNAELTSSLVLTIFAYDTPLHDGALILQSGKIVAAGCFLPLSDQYDIKKVFGTRHRAALGLAEESDAVVLIVSEETGAISLAYDANLHYDLSTKEVTTRLYDVLNLHDSAAEESGEMIDEV